MAGEKFPIHIFKSLVATRCERLRQFMTQAKSVFATGKKHVDISNPPPPPPPFLNLLIHLFFWSPVFNENDVKECGHQWDSSIWMTIYFNCKLILIHSWLIHDFKPISLEHQYAHFQSHRRCIYQGADKDNMSLVTLRG